MLWVDGDPADSRRRVLTTTSLIEDYWEQRNDGDYAALADWFGMLTREELQELCDLLGRVLAGPQSGV
jgi:MarR family transcriptional regulator, transcriptional regulator for hemolysin